MVRSLGNTALLTVLSTSTGFKGTTNVTASIGTLTAGELARDCMLGEKYVGEKAKGLSVLGRVIAPDWSLAGKPSPKAWGYPVP